MLFRSAALLAEGRDARRVEGGEVGRLRDGVQRLAAKGRKVTHRSLSESDTKKGSLWSRLPLCDPCPVRPGDGGRTLLEGGLGLVDQGLERRRLPHRQVGHDLAVDLDPGLEDAVHELRVGETVLASRRVDALDPEATERALLVAAIPVGVLEALLDLLDADAERRLDRKSTRLNSSHVALSRMPSSA